MTDTHHSLSGEFAEDVRSGLGATEKSIPSRWLYDELGSQIFEEICNVPEYYPTDAEVEILKSFGPELNALLGRDLTVLELGSGSAVKARHVLDALKERGNRLLYKPLDISASAVTAAAEELRVDFPQIRVEGIAGEYRHGIQWIGENPSTSKLVMWLGSNVGNFEREEGNAFVRDLARGLGESDFLLMGVDLRKDARTLEQAYDDPAGVTRRFTLNLLTRMNRELGAHFEPEGFDHEARYEVQAGRVVIGLRSLRDQKVKIDSLDETYSFAKGELIHTEYSVKYSHAEIEELAASAGLHVERTWMDSQERYALQLMAPGTKC